VDRWKTDIGGLLMATSFTPGPWETVHKGQFVRIRQKVDSDVTIADTGIWAEKFHEEMCANADLIAAAPDLLEALKYARRMVKASECDIAFIDAAIAKAQGA
jgi:hypothetical protein